MPLPANYTEVSFAEYLHSQLYGVAGALGWTVADDSYAEIITDTLVAYGESDIETITGEANLVKLRALGKYRVWCAAVDGLAAKYDYATNNQRFDLSQMQKMARTALQQAEQAAGAYGVGNYAIRVGRVIRTQEPYSYIDPDLQTIP